MHCPENYSSEEKEKDINSITETLNIFFEEFGPLKKWEISDSNLYVTATTACGTVPYWKVNPTKSTLIYSTKYATQLGRYISTPPFLASSLYKTG